MIFNFEKLIVWQKSKDLVKTTYDIIKKFPGEERYVLSDQLRRAVISIASNIAEGNERPSVKDKTHFLDISLGSLFEAYNQFHIAKDLGYLSDNELMDLGLKCEEIAKMINSYKSSLLNPKF